MPWVVDVPPPFPKSEQPLGGTPADDRAYLAWRDAFLLNALERDVIRRWHEAFDRPLRLDGWRLDRHLFRSLRGELPLFQGEAPTTPNHRLRFLSIQLKNHRRRTTEAAHRFVDEATHEVDRT